MSSRKTLILIGALLVGGLAAFLTLNYVRGVENRVDEDTELSEVVIAAAPLAKGTQASTAIAEGGLTTAERARKDIPANAVTRLADIEGQVAAINLGGGEIVTSTMFAGIQDLTGSRSASLDEGNVAITVAVDSASMSGGLIQPGDLVNLLVRFAVIDETGEGAGDDSSLGVTGGGVSIPKPAGYVFQAVKVFAVGTDSGTAVAATAPAEGEAEAEAEELNLSTALTLQMPPQDAALLASVRDAELYASLVPPDYEIVPIPVVFELPSFPGMAGTSIYLKETPGAVSEIVTTDDTEAAETEPNLDSDAPQPVLNVSVAVVEFDMPTSERITALLGEGVTPFTTLEELTSRLTGAMPVVAVLGPSCTTPEVLSMIERVNQEYPFMATVLVVNELSTSLLQQALRVGVRDVLGLCPVRQVRWLMRFSGWR